MNVTCFTDAAIQAQLNKVVEHHVAKDVSAVIAARQEAPSIADVVSRTRRYAGEVFVVDGHSTDGTPELAPRCGASVLADGGRGKGDAIRRAIPHIRTPVTVFLDADGSHDPEWRRPVRDPFCTSEVRLNAGRHASGFGPDGFRHPFQGAPRGGGPVVGLHVSSQLRMWSLA
jgi:cellulose synthase/poly-beta-1,6-N-acetylglucosamine synthase-like glycosyltransferase